MTTPPLWPALPDDPGRGIRHGWRCTRTGAVEEATRRAPSGAIVTVAQCSECGYDDFSWRIEREARP